MSKSIARATKGACPYCDESTLQKAPGNRPRPDEVAMQCSNVNCLKYCTSTNGMFYPHDDHADASSPIAKVVRY